MSQSIPYDADNRPSRSRNDREDAFDESVHGWSPIDGGALQLPMRDMSMSLESLESLDEVPLLSQVQKDNALQHIFTSPPPPYTDARTTPEKPIPEKTPEYSSVPHEEIGKQNRKVELAQYQAMIAKDYQATNNGEQDSIHAARNTLKWIYLQHQLYHKITNGTYIPRSRLVHFKKDLLDNSNFEVFREVRTHARWIKKRVVDESLVKEYDKKTKSLKQPTLEDLPEGDAKRIMEYINQDFRGTGNVGSQG